MTRLADCSRSLILMHSNAALFCRLWESSDEINDVKLQVADILLKVDTLAGDLDNGNGVLLPAVQNVSDALLVG